MKLPERLDANVGASVGDAPLVRVAAVCLIAGVTITALYFGRDVLIPSAVAVLLAFILGPPVTFVQRLLPLPMSVTVVVVGAVVVVGLLTVLMMAQLAEVAGSLTSYQANLHQKVQDIRQVSQGGSAFSRFISMIASIGQELAVTVEPGDKPVRVLSGATGFETIAAFVAPLMHPVLTISIVIILVVFILLDREHLSDQIVRLFGANDVHATSEAIGDAASRLGRLLALQLMTNLGFAVAVGVGLFALGMPNAALWGLLAGMLRFVPYIGAALGALLPTLIAFAVAPGWLQPFLVLAWIIGCDLVIGQVIEPILFGETIGVTPLALILSAIFWGTLWGPLGILLSTPLTICLLVLGRHVPQLGFLQILLTHEPALAPYQRIYRRLIRRAVADASTVALAEIEEKGAERGLDDSLGRMVVLAEFDRALDRLSAAQIDAIVDGTDEILDLIAADAAEGREATSPAADAGGGIFFSCVGGRGQVDDAAAAIVAFALRRTGLQAFSHRHGENSVAGGGDGSLTTHLICYASRPSPAVRRYTSRKHNLGGAEALPCHVVIDYHVTTTATPIERIIGSRDILAGDLATICRAMAEHAVVVAARPAAFAAAGR